MDHLDAATAALLERERALLTQLGALLGRADAPEDTRRRLADLVRALDELFLVVVAGEFNAGKSTLVNALFGRRVMEEGPVPTTDKITVLRHGDADATHRRSDFVTERTLRHPLLERLALVDTPGTNSIVLEHQRLTEDFIPRADLVLFVTSYDRPLSESERQLLDYIGGAWGKRLVVALNKADLTAGEEALAQVQAHVRDGMRELTGSEPLLFPVAARLALEAKLAHGADGLVPASGDADDAALRADPRWQDSRFGPFERFISEKLSDRDRLAIKLGSPLAAAGALLDDAEARLGEREALFAADAEALGGLRGRFAEAREALAETATNAVTAVDRELLEMEKRGTRFLDDAIRVSRLNLIRDRNAFREEFQRQVVRDAEARIETRLGEAADAVLRRVYALWNETYTRLADLQRPDAAPRDGFLYDRDEVLRDVLREARRTVESYDVEEEARRLLENARSALTVGGVAAAGVGAAAVVLIAATAFDVTGGLVAAGALATLGLVVLPRQRRKAVQEFSERVEALRGEMRGALARELGTEADEALAKVQALVAPVEALVSESLAAAAADRAEADRLRADAAALRAEVRAAYGDGALAG